MKVPKILKELQKTKKFDRDNYVCKNCLETIIKLIQKEKLFKSKKVKG